MTGDGAGDEAGHEAGHSSGPQTGTEAAARAIGERLRAASSSAGELAGHMAGQMAGHAATPRMEAVGGVGREGGLEAGGWRGVSRGRGGVSRAELAEFVKEVGRLHPWAANAVGAAPDATHEAPLLNWLSENVWLPRHT